MRILIALHRWWGVAFCLLFAAWFASGIVMHFVPFPARIGVDRLAGRMAIDRDKVRHGPSEAVAASGIQDVSRLRLAGRRDGPVYLVSGPSVARVLRAADLGDAGVRSERAALDIAIGRGLDAAVEGALNIGPASRAMEGYPAEVRAAAKASIRDVLVPFLRGESVPLAASIWIVTARVT